MAPKVEWMKGRILVHGKARPARKILSNNNMMTILRRRIKI
jgi:hypothetical protein